LGAILSKLGCGQLSTADAGHMYPERLLDQPVQLNL
jgi:hypothetical protein